MSVRDEPVSATDYGLEDFVTQSLPPNHILADGRMIYLPPPTAAERQLFFERSIARTGLLQEDLADKKKVMSEEEQKDPEKKEEKVKVHPLALASARLQTDGINELNRAINLSSLVSTGDYFGMSNIVDPALEVAATTSSTETKATDGDKAPDTGTGPKSESAQELQEEQRVKATYTLKRKRHQFLKASAVLERHKHRLEQAIVAQSRPDSRLRSLRHKWRLVAPEHGTRALAHAARPSETLACDLDLYIKGGAVLGRLASRVPRFATVELSTNYKLDADLDVWRKRYRKNNAMDLDDDTDDLTDGLTEQQKASMSTIAEPFAMADPTLGKIDADFDPKRIVMLSLQFTIETASTGCCQSARLEPISLSYGTSASMPEDETKMISLQHSLLCAKLFESIRRELAFDTEEVGNIRTTEKAQSVAWLGVDADNNFLPPPSLLSGEERPGGLTQLCVIHCHEGEVKVQLDCEYTLSVKLVEADDHAEHNIRLNDMTGGSSNPVQTASSGSQSPDQLSTLCQVLLFYAQSQYHKHSIQAAETMHKNEENEKAKAAISLKKEPIPSPRILQRCVSLGSKMLFERRIRAALVKINNWLRSSTQPSESLQIEWLSLSVFDLHSCFTLVFRSLVLDAHLQCEELTVTSHCWSSDDSSFRKVTFHSDSEFELYLKLALGRLLRES